MVSNEEIKRMLKNRRSGIKTGSKKETPSPVPPKSTEPTKPSSESQSCASCGAQNPKDAKFCIKCGKTLKAESEVEVKEKVETVPENLPRSGMDGVDYKTCPNCSHQNQPQAKFCVVCGHKLEETPDEVSQPGKVSRLDRVQDISEPEEETTTEQPAEKTPAVAELVNEELVQEETSKRSLLSRKLPEEETNPEDAPLEIAAHETSDITMETGDETHPEEVPVTESAPEEVTTSESAPEKVTNSESAAGEEDLGEEVSEETSPEEELPQVKTFKWGQDSLEMEEPETPKAALEIEETVAEDTTEGDTEEVPPATSQPDPIEKIRKAKELLDIGAITEEEFEEIKKKYLAMI